MQQNNLDKSEIIKDIIMNRCVTPRVNQEFELKFNNHEDEDEDEFPKTHKDLEVDL